MRKLLTGLILAAFGLASPALGQRIQAPGNVAIGCAYNASPPTLTTGWFGYVQCDSSGKLITTASGGGGGAVTIADGADVTQGAIADAATTAGGAGTLSAKLRLVTTQLSTLATALTTINTTLGTPFQAGGSIGNTTFAVTQGTSPWVVSGTVTATIAANQSVNVAQVNGTTTLAGTGAVGTGAQRIAVGTDTATIAGSAPGTAGTPSAQVVSVQNPAADPCQTIAATYTPISITSATTTRIVAPTSAKKTYVCYLFMISAIANNVAIVEGTGGTCGAATAGVVGGTTAANGLNFAANSGAAFQAGGNAAFATAGTNVDLCLITSAIGPLAGAIKWVQAP